MTERIERTTKHDQLTTSAVASTPSTSCTMLLCRMQRHTSTSMQRQEYCPPSRFGMALHLTSSPTCEPPTSVELTIFWRIGCIIRIPAKKHTACWTAGAAHHRLPAALDALRDVKCIAVHNAVVGRYGLRHPTNPDLCMQEQSVISQCASQDPVESNNSASNLLYITHPLLGLSNRLLPPRRRRCLLRWARLLHRLLSLRRPGGLLVRRRAGLRSGVGTGCRLLCLAVQLLWLLIGPLLAVQGLLRLIATVIGAELAAVAAVWAGLMRRW